jgi:hypothetical protein
MNTLQQYTHAIADYIDCEYNDLYNYLDISDVERLCIKNMITEYYHNHDSINNAASSIIMFLQSTRHLTKDSNDY